MIINIPVQSTISATHRLSFGPFGTAGPPSLDLRSPGQTARSPKNHRAFADEF
jgi:hypothetical protein